MKGKVGIRRSHGRLEISRSFRLPIVSTGVRLAILSYCAVQTSTGRIPLLPTILLSLIGVTLAFSFVGSLPERLEFVAADQSGVRAADVKEVHIVEKPLAHSGRWQLQFLDLLPGQLEVVTETEVFRFGCGVGSDVLIRIASEISDFCRANGNRIRAEDQRTRLNNDKKNGSRSCRFR